MLLDFMLAALRGPRRDARRRPRSACARTSSSRAGSPSAGRCCSSSRAKGLSREDAYALCSATRWTPGTTAATSASACSADPEICEVLAKEEIDRAFSLDEALRHVDAIFAARARRGRRRDVKAAGPRDPQAATCSIRRARRSATPARRSATRGRERAPGQALRDRARRARRERRRAACSRARARSCSRTR